MGSPNTVHVMHGFTLVYIYIILNLSRGLTRVRPAKCHWALEIAARVCCKAAKPLKIAARAGPEAREALKIAARAWCMAAKALKITD